MREQKAMNIDWFPTILDLCDISYELDKIDGKSLLPLIENSSKQSQHDVLFFDSGNQWAVIQNDWKLIYNPQDPTTNKITDKFYLTNIKKDVGEANNYAGKNNEKIEELLQLRHEFEKTYKNQSE